MYRIFCIPGSGSGWGSLNLEEGRLIDIGNLDIFAYYGMSVLPTSVTQGTEIIVGGSATSQDELEAIIAPIFEDNCTGCHAGAISPDLRTDKSWSELTSNNLVDPADPEGSELMEKINADHGVPLSALQKAQVLKWIQDGAENN